jgi:regulator of RNase E activity RraA
MTTIDLPAVDDVAFLDVLAGHCYAAVFSDVCDALGHRDATAAPGLHRYGGTGLALGWARTARSVGVREAPARAYGGEIDYLDSLSPGDLAVVVTDGSPVAAWGELFSSAAMARGARGAVVDGVIRDTAKIARLGYPVFARGTRPTDALGRISLVEQDVEVVLAGVSVRPGDLVAVDDDGIVVIPRERAPEAAERAIAKATTESIARADLMAGGYLRDVWERYRVL